MAQKRLYTNIFTQSAKEHLLDISGPRPGELERVKKDIFQKLATRYPQQSKRSEYSFVRQFKWQYSFGFAAVIVIFVCASVYFSSKDNFQETANVKKTVAPNETVLVKEQKEVFSPSSESKDKLNETVIARHQDRSGDVNQVHPDQNTPVPITRKNVSETKPFTVPESYARTEGYLASAAGDRAIIPEISEIQVEFIVSINK